MSLSCPKCGKEVPSRDYAYCPFCGARVRVVAPGVAGSPVIGGILAVIASCTSLFVAVFCLMSIAQWYFPWRLQYLLACLLSLVGFGFGLTAGVEAFKRNRYAYVISGLLFLLLSSLINIAFLAAIPGHTGTELFIIYNAPIILLTPPSIIYIVTAKEEFT